MGGIVAHAEQAAVDLGMKGLDPAVEHLGKAGKLGDILDGEPLFAQQLGGAAGGENFDAEAGQLPGEVDDAGFIGNTDQSPFDDGHGENPFADELAFTVQAETRKKPS